MAKPSLPMAQLHACPDENALAQFAQGSTSVAIETHLDGCESCRRAVAAAASEHTLPSVAPALDLTPGQRVGRYEIERELGRGGMGVVYMARDLTLDRHVALKLLHARRDEAAQARLLREAQVMAKLAHQNVVPVFELGDWHGDLYLVMELVGGVTLETWLKASKHPKKEILSAFIQAGRGLAAAHAAGVVHRDFKPANVLVGLEGRVRVTDFGLSRPGAGTALMELPPMASPLVTREGTLVGTLVYMSPEQLDGKPATELSDQFSFCVSLAEALSGVRPFEGQSWSELAVSQANTPALPKSIPASVRTVLRKGLSASPDKRYASMTTMLNALERAEDVGWKEVGLIGFLAVTGIAGIIALTQPTPPRPATEVRSSAQTPEGTRTVMIAAHDIAEGTRVTYDMLVQRQMPEQFVTPSFVDPESVNYIINQRTHVPISAGDALLWQQFETIQKPADDDGALSTLQSEDFDRAATDGFNDLLTVIARGKPQLVSCVEAFKAEHPTATGTIVLRWKNTPSGVPTEVRADEPSAGDSKLVGCIVDAFKTWRFPPDPSQTSEMRFPIKF